MNRRRYLPFFLVTAIFILYFFFRAPSAPISDPLDALSPYASYLSLHGISQKDVLSYTITKTPQKTTLELTLRTPDQQQRVLSIAVHP